MPIILSAILIDEWRMAECIIRAPESESIDDLIEKMDDVSQEVETSYTIDLKESIVSLQFKIGLTALDSARARIGVEGRFRVEIDFWVDNLDELVTEERVQTELIPLLVSTGYSTVRGILLVYTKGTALEYVPTQMLRVRDLLGQEQEALKRSAGRPRRTYVWPRNL